MFLEVTSDNVEGKEPYRKLKSFKNTRRDLSLDFHYFKSEKALKREDPTAKLSYGDLRDNFCGVECDYYANGYVVEYWEYQYCGYR